MFFKNIVFLIGEIIDLVFVVTLFMRGQFWFGAMYLSADILPAIVFMYHWYMLQEEKNWKFLVNLQRK